MFSRILVIPMHNTSYYVTLNTLKADPTQILPFSVIAGLESDFMRRGCRLLAPYFSLNCRGKGKFQYTRGCGMISWNLFCSEYNICLPHFCIIKPQLIFYYSTVLLHFRLIECSKATICSTGNYSYSTFFCIIY